MVKIHILFLAGTDAKSNFRVQLIRMKLAQGSNLPRIEQPMNQSIDTRQPADDRQTSQRTDWRTENKRASEKQTNEEPANKLSNEKIIKQMNEQINKWMHDS